MSEINDGGLAFPGQRHEQVTQSDGSTRWADVIYPGMSLRDWFAGQALAGLLANSEMSFKGASECAYDHADAMLAERAKAEGRS